MRNTKPAPRVLPNPAVELARKQRADRAAYDAAKSAPRRIAPSEPVARPLSPVERRAALSGIIAPNTPRARSVVNYSTRTKSRNERGNVPADRGYTVGKSRETVESHPDPILSGGARLMKLLSGQSPIVCQRVVSAIASLKSAPREHVVRELIMREVQRAEREG